MNELTDTTRERMPDWVSQSWFLLNWVVFPQPNDPDQEQNCGAATANSKQEWQDKPCEEKRPFLCQFPPRGYKPDAGE